MDRLALSASGQVRYTLKTPWRDGTTHVVLDPLDFIARLAGGFSASRSTRAHIALDERGAGEDDGFEGISYQTLVAYNYSLSTDAYCSVAGLPKRLLFPGASQPASTYRGESKMIELIPDAKQLSVIFSQAIAPTFFLGAVAGFLSLMTSRLSGVMRRVQAVNAIDKEDPARAHLKDDLERLRRRARFLNSGILAALYSGLCATVLLGILFIAALFSFEHAYGAPGLFVLATIFLGFALFRFAQETRIGLTEADEYL